ncbi:acyl-CoA dehydrogenase family protein [Temperatibacter marinus]|uniref:Acyl-CoA dehydrogenase family protein n=1 Tax=Temperatibacter marinus TaxID=1456591 RepID=A0AA52H9P5_9PROT|nr:acyl-CoA dehydrogenase family protein [Temperatibacter marinus]WND01823.1 acyl-CoA dehydrogenase family protein [Temperatibacter marinus]
MVDFTRSARIEELIEKVTTFIEDEILPLEEEYWSLVGAEGDRWSLTSRQTEILESLKAKAKAKNLWNFFLPDSQGGYGLSNVEYAYLAEEMGRSHIASEVFNCAAPDTGNMEVFERYGTQAHKDKWLKPLLAGEIRSAYVMTEPDVASSDATNIALEAKLDGDEWVLNGEKYWASGAGDKRCKIWIVMCRTADEDTPRHNRHTMILVEPSTEGVEVLRPMTVFGSDDAPHGHMHIRFTNVRVPKENVIHGEGTGFEVAQGRLGPGRIHHCMRSIGAAEKALDLMIKRALSREAFGKPMVKLGANYDIIAECRIEIEMARLLCLKAAYMMDTIGVKAASPWISKIKVVAPRMSLKVIDESMQMFGGTGVSQDTPLASMYAAQRTLRFADGPDAVHRMVIARTELKKYRDNKV